MSVEGFIINGKTERYLYDALYGAPIEKGTGTDSIALASTLFPNTASGDSAMAFGQESEASGPMSFVFGNHVSSTGRACVVIGQFNSIDENAEDSSHGAGARKYLFIVGNGTDDNTRSNALTVDWDGNVVASGKMTVGAAPTNDLDVATKEYVDDSLETFQTNVQNGFESIQENVQSDLGSLQNGINNTKEIALKAFSTTTSAQASIVSVSPEYAAENVPVIVTPSEVSASKIYKTGVNIANTQYESGIWNDFGEKEYAELAIRSKDYIPVAKNTTYYVAYSTDEAEHGLTFRKYGRNKNYIGFSKITAQSKLLTTDANCYFVTWSTDPNGDNLTGIRVESVVEGSEEPTYGPYTYYITNPPSINYPSTDETWHRHWEEVKDISEIADLTTGSETTNFFCDYGELSVEYRLKPKESDSEIMISVSVPGNDDVVEEIFGWEDEFGVWHEVIPNTYELIPSKFYHFVPSNSNASISSLNIVLKPPTIGMAHYHFDFDTGSTAPTLSLPATVNMPSNFYLEANKHYEIDIFNNFGMVVAWTIS